MGSVFISDANEEEALSMLIGCKEFKAMHGFKAILMGLLFRLYNGVPLQPIHGGRLIVWRKFSSFCPC